MSPRLRAFLVHLSVSALVLAAVAAVVLLWWYPGPMLSLQGGQGVMLIILLVDLVLGPSLTGMIYKPGKKNLKLDLSAIVLLQLAALAYGVVTLYAQRPSYLAFTLDRFFVVSVTDTVGNLPPEAGLSTWRGSVRLGTAPVTALTTSESLDDLETVSADNLIPPLALNAADIVPYPGKVIRPTIGNGRLLAEIQDAAVRREAIAVAAQSGLPPESTRAYRVVGRKNSAVALVRVQDGRILDILR